MLVEAGRRQPRTLANAFLKPISTRSRDGVLPGAVQALGDHLSRFDRMYGKKEGRRIAAMADISTLTVKDAGSLDALAGWAAGLVRGNGAP